MSESHILHRGRICLLATCLAAATVGLGFAQEPHGGQRPEAKPATETELEQVKRSQRRAFQGQELITAQRNGWILRPATAPRIVWRDVEEVRRLGFDGPLRIRWFDARLNEVDVPAKPGRWGAWIEGTAPNGLPFRRSLTFYAPTKGSLLFLGPKINLSMPEIPETPAADVLREHQTELSRLWTGTMHREFADSEMSAVVLAGLGELKPIGRQARFVESVTVLNEDYHLALKLKMQSLLDSVHPLQTPRCRATPAVTLREGSPEEAGALLDAKARIDAVCRAWADDAGEPFVTLVARRGVIVTHEAFGEDDEGKRIDRDYRCWIASITKSVTALLFAQFLDQRLIALDDSVATVFPDYPKNSPHVPTFRQCFNHTSGLKGHGEFGGFRHTHYENVVLNAIDVNQPNVRYVYSGTGFELAAKAMELVAGKSAVRLYDEHLFRPLDFGDVQMGNASSDGHLTAKELAILAQMVSNRGSYGEREFFSPSTFDSLLPKPLGISQAGAVKEEGIGLHWMRRARPGAPRAATRPEDHFFSPGTVGYGSFSGCIFMVDLEQDLVITQVRRRTGPRWGEWATRYFQAISDAIECDEPVDDGKPPCPGSP